MLRWGGVGKNDAEPRHVSGSISIHDLCCIQRGCIEQSRYTVVVLVWFWDLVLVLILTLALAGFALVVCFV